MNRYIGATAVVGAPEGGAPPRTTAARRPSRTVAERVPFLTERERVANQILAVPHVEDQPADDLRIIGTRRGEIRIHALQGCAIASHSCRFSPAFADGGLALRRGPLAPGIPRQMTTRAAGMLPGDERDAAMRCFAADAFHRTIEGSRDRFELLGLLENG